MLGPSPYLIWWTLHKGYIEVELVNQLQLWFWQSLLTFSPTNRYLPTVLVTNLNTWHLWPPVYSNLKVLLPQSCTCSLIAVYSAICTTLVLKTSLHSLTRCLYMSDTEGDWEWVQWGHWCRLVPTGGTTGTQATHTEGNSEHLPSRYWTM